MADHLEYRLETTAGVVVAYLAPVSVVDAPGQNALTAAPRPGDRGALARDLQLWSEEIQVHGKFLASSELPDAHKAALEALFGGPCTAEQQARRLNHYFKKVGGNFRFYLRSRSYIATTDAAIDHLNGVWPTVAIADFHEKFPSGTDTIDYFLKLAVGLKRPG